MTKFTHKAVVVPLIRENHPDADSLSIVRVNGTVTVVIRTEDWVGHDKAVYIPPQNIVDTAREEFAWLSHLCKDGQTRVRIKPVKLRGVYSHGLFVKCPEGAEVGDDLTEHFGVEHWEPEVEGGGATHGGLHNSISKYDIDSVHKFKLDESIDIVATEKIHGCFEESSLVMMADGTEKPISQVEEGEYVKSYDPETKTFVDQRVIGKLVRVPCDGWLHIELDNGRTIKCTENHLFLTNEGWMEAGKITDQEIISY